MGNPKLQFAVRAALAAAAASAVVPMAYAQTAPAAQSAAADTALEEVVVTGSRLSQLPNEVSISPVTSITDLDIAKTGLVRTEDLLNNLPQVIAEQSSGTSISSNGTATVSLRGLGSQRTLVLVNGKRLMPGAGLGPTVGNSADINQIPADLIERADILTGGASAVYGADAVAGVVNFVLNTHFEGVRIDSNYGFGRHSNSNQQQLGYLAVQGDPPPDSTVDAGFSKDINFLAGANFADGKGNATVYATYRKDSPAVGYQYDFAGCTLNTPGRLPTTAANDHLRCGGSSSSATGRFLLLGQTAKSNFATLADNTVSKNGNYDPYSAADSYNYGALSYLQRAAERYTAGNFLTYDVNDNASVYSEFMFARNTSSANYGPSGLFAFGQEVISCQNNPLLTGAELLALCGGNNIAENQATYGPTNAGGFKAGNPNVTGSNILVYMARRSVESGPRIDNYASDSFREVVGVKGKFNDAITYDVYGQVGLTHMTDVEGGFLGSQQVDRSLNVVAGPGGVPACASALNGDDPACVPWNIWNPGAVSAAQLKYLTVASGYEITTKEYIVDGSMTADLGKYGVQLPTASSGLNLAVGTEYRQESYDFEPDYIFGNGFASGGNGAQPPINGGFHVAEIFTEFHMPLLEDKFLAKALSVEGGYRYSSYTTGVDTNTYKFGLEWTPISDVKLRGGYNRAVRAPSISDLLAPAVVGAGGTADPCWSSAPVLSLVQCERTGVTQAEYGHILANPAAQINTSLAGNVNLTPEIADTFSYGFVVTPQAIPGFVTSVDFYYIRIKNAIESLSSNTIINDCALSGNATLCGLIHRGGNGSLWFNNTQFVDVREENIGVISTKGIDLSSSYHFDVGQFGKVSVNLAGTRVLNFFTRPVALPEFPSSYDCAGYFGSTCGAPTPHWRHVLNTDWQAPWAGLDLSLRWRYIGPTNSDRVSQDPQLSAAFLQQTAHIGGFSYLDMSLGVPVASTGINLRVGVNNITDKAPPIVANGNYSDCPNTSCNDNTWVGTYDTLGRYLYARVSVKF